MAISRYAAVVDAVLSTLRASTDLDEVGIFDGPPLLVPEDTQTVYVGWTGDIDNDSAGSIAQSYHDLGPAAMRDERVEVYLTIQVVRGDDEMAEARLRAIAILGVVESALRATVGLGVSESLRIEFSDASVRQVRNEDGIGFELGTTLTANSLI